MWRNPHQATSGPMWQSMWGSETDPVLSAGGVYLANAASGLLLPPFPANYTRSGPDLWCPQADGSLASFAANVIPREFAGGRWGFRFDPGWTQYITRTHDFSHSTWTKRRATVVPVSIATPDGLGSAFKLVEDTTAANSHYLESEFVNIAATRGCFIVKAAEVTEIGIRYIRDTGVSFGGANARVDLLTGAVTLGALNVEPLGGGWWKVTCIPDGTATTNVSIRLSLVKGGSETYNGDGASGVYVLAANATSTAYPVPLTVAQGTAGTVGNHSCSALLSALGVTLGSEFGLGVEAVALNKTAGKFPSMLALRVAAANNSSTTAEFFINPGPGYSAVVKSAGVEQFAHYPTANTPTKFAMRVKANDFRAAFSGALSPADTSGGVPSFDTVNLGFNTPTDTAACHVTRAYLIQNRAPTDAELQAVTA